MNQTLQILLNDTTAILPILEDIDQYSLGAEMQDFERHCAEDGGPRDLNLSQYNIDTFQGVGFLLEYLLNDPTIPDNLRTHALVKLLLVRKYYLKMRRVLGLERFKVGDPVLYIPDHAHGDRDHRDCERGVVSTVTDLEAGGQLVWVRFKGPTGESTPVKNLVKL